MTEAAFNEEVTAEMLNNIGKDLGLAEFSYFENDMPYAVHLLNKITSDLVGSGVLRTEKNGGLGCEVIEQEGRAYVQAGVIVFDSGAKIRITEPVGLDLLPDSTIFAVYDANLGTARIETASEVPSTGDCVLLAKTDESGNISDKRSACVAKAVMTADPQNVYYEFEESCLTEASEAEFEVDVGTGAFSYVYVLGAVSYGDSLVPMGDNAAELSEDEEAEFSMGRSRSDYVHMRLYFKKEGQRLNVRIYRSGAKGQAHTIKFLVM